MVNRYAPAVALLLLACPPLASDTESDATTGEESSTTASTTTSGATEESSTTSGEETATTTATATTTGEGSSTTDDLTSSTDPTYTGGPVCGDGYAEPPEECDDGEDTVLCDGDCTAPACGDGYANAAAGEECDDGNADDSDECLSSCKAASCGDGILGPGEECDGGEKCDDDCTTARWSHGGPAINIETDELVKWDECFSTLYDGKDAVDDVVGPMNGACQGDHLALGCRKVGSSILIAVAHAPRADVLWPTVGETDVHPANGSDWYFGADNWGFLPEGGYLDKVNCDTTEGAPDDAERLCWNLNDGAFTNLGMRCGDTVIPLSKTPMWERVVLESWD